jgi:hypothetical protein
MFLHNDIKNFAKLIGSVHRATRIGRAFIEKDYFVALFLKRLAEMI